MILLDVGSRSAPRAKGRPVSATAGSLSGLRLLIVDDEADARDLVREVLEGAGAKLLANGSAGWLMPRSGTFPRSR